MSPLRLIVLTCMIGFHAGQLAFSSTPAELTKVAFVAGQDSSQSNYGSTQLNLQHEWERLARIVQYDQPVSNDPNAQAIWEQAQAHAREALVALAGIHQIDNDKPSDWNTVVSGFKAAMEDTKNKRRTEWGSDVWVRLVAEGRKSLFQSDFRTAEAALDRKLTELASTAGGFTTGAGIRITHLPSWQGAYDNDLVSLKNETGTDLAAAAIFVFIQGKDGAVKTHLHRVAGWNKDQNLVFRYPFEGSDYFDAGTVTEPGRVTVAVFSQDASFRAIKSWNAPDFDDTVRGYLSDVRLTGIFLGEYREEGTNELYFPGVKFSIEGVHRLPIRRIKVRFTRRGETQEVYWDWNKFLITRDSIVLRSSYFSRFGKYDPPEQRQVILEFTDSSVAAAYTW